MMKKCLLFWLFLLLLLSGCRPAEPEAPPEEEPAALTLPRLAVEIPRGTQSPEILAQALRELPQALTQALAVQGVTAEAVTVSVGSSPEATAQALQEGGIDLAFLPAEDFAALENPPQLLLASGPLSPDLEPDPALWNQPDTAAGTVPGTPVLLCAAPTDYGRALAEREDPLDWTDLAQARWALPAGQESLANLFLPADRSWEELPQAVFCADEAGLFQSAAAGDADLLLLYPGSRAQWAAPDSASVPGWQGLGRTASLYEELPVLAVSGRLYQQTVSVRSGGGVLEDPRFASALAAALPALEGQEAIFGSHPYAPVEETALDAQRQLFSRA
ncbi:MAG: DUF2309 domain-containing protein [Oscillibacter sp.]|nr:DUF2309 domain-containing protein [Oscillibacter sp.]